MTVEEMKAAIAEEVKSFKDSLKDFQSKEDMTKALNEFKSEIDKKFEGQVDAKAIEKLEKQVEKQGELLTSLKLAGGNQSVKTLKDQLKESEAEISKMVENGGAGRIEIKTTLKAVQSTSITNDTNALRPQALPGEIHRGVPYLRNLFPVVTLGGNTHGSVKWYEQQEVTDNASTVAETRALGDQSALTWVEKTISGKRIADWAKIGVDQLKDVDFVLGEIQRLVERNMRLKENDLLMNGLGTGNEIKGIKAYAKEFDVTGIKIPFANFVDLIGKIGTQVDSDLKGAATLNYFIANRKDTDKVRFEKTTQGAYVFPQWTMGNGSVNVGSVMGVENPLVTENTLIAGDFSLATLYVWDDLVIEIAQIEDDKKTGMTTILAYMRENLRVQDVDKDAFVKVTNLTDTLQAITKTNG